MVLNFVFTLSVIWSFLPSMIMVRAVTREYYIAAVIKEWNYAPSGQNQIKGVALQDDRYAKSVLCRKQLLLLLPLGLLWLLQKLTGYSLMPLLKRYRGVKNMVVEQRRESKTPSNSMSSRLLLIKLYRSLICCSSALLFSAIFSAAQWCDHCF